MTRKFFTAACCCAVLTLTFSCEKISELLETDVTLDDLTLNFEANLEEASLPKTTREYSENEDGYRMPFATTVQYSLATSDDLESLNQYANRIKSVTVSSASVVATAVGGVSADKSIYDFAFTSASPAGDWTIAECPFGTAVSAQDKQLQFLQALFEAVLMNNKTVTVEVSGESDVVTATKVSIKLTVNGKLRVGLLSDND